MTFIVEIVPHDPAWSVRFAQMGTALREALGDTARRIDHIGSTSIPALAAKPIIDIQLSVAVFEPLDAYRLPLEQLGYVFRADNPERTKRYFRETPGTPRTHLHVRRVGSWAEQFALLFRDYLRTHAEEARRYAALKYRLAALYREDRHGYTEAKTPSIWEIMVKADRWSQEVGWEPGPSDV
ncbi:MAG: GrpB family protein [Candidatus Tectomicrobia bacterium]|nr:GrpB family protein [Candidatus Tectomicrobia bacterium]